MNQTQKNNPGDSFEDRASELEITETETSEAQRELMEAIPSELNPENVDVQKFIIDGEVDLESVERFKNVLSANDLEILNQLRPGILFDLFVEVSGDQLLINFAGNADADAEIGLSQIMRGTSSKYEGRLENIRTILVQEDSGPVHEATRDGLAGNYYETNSSYQEVHTGYTIEISQENTEIAAQIEQVEAEAEEEVRKLTRKHLNLARVPDEDAPEIAHFKYKDKKEKYKYKENPSRRAMLEHSYVEAKLHDIDPLFVMALLDSALPAHEGQFENDFQWTMRTIQQYQRHYESATSKKAMDENNQYTAEFITYLINSGQELMAHVDRDRFQEMYGKITDQEFEWKESAVGLSTPRFESIRQIEDPKKHAGISKLVKGGHLSSDYGPRPDPFTGKPSGHHGIDIGALSGKPIRTIEGGVVLQATFQGGANGGGNYVRILHPSGFVTQYLHCSGFAPGITQGAIVEPGQPIASVGSTGRSTGAHLHYEAFELTSVSDEELKRFNVSDENFEVPTKKEVIAMNRKTSGKGNRNYGEGPWAYLEGYV
jgi:murein DD-endopeptidase MepM/ murein hydrolase activator NlpD